MLDMIVLLIIDLLWWYWATQYGKEEAALSWPYRALTEPEFSDDIKRTMLKQAHREGARGVVSLALQCGLLAGAWSYKWESIIYSAIASMIMAAGLCLIIFWLVYPKAKAKAMGVEVKWVAATTFDAMLRKTFGQSIGKKKNLICLIAILILHLTFFLINKTLI
jgi:hypothetical protein